MEKMELKAVALLSGGLDSTLAVKLVLDQGIEVRAVNFKTIFCTCDHRKGCRSEARRVAEKFGIDLKIFDVTREYIPIVKNPKYGYGTNMNPCIDCRILMLKKAAEYMEELGASFLVTGEVLGERPMSQRRDAMNLIEKEAGLKGKILRPLSARLLKPTIAEERGWIDRQRLLDIQGRSRKPQMELACAHGIGEYPTPAGGCLLTDPGFANRIRDLFQHGDASINDIQLLKYGRHFRLSKDCKVVVGRDEEENERMLNLARPEDLILKVANFSGPITLLRGQIAEELIHRAAAITARYSKAKDEAKVKVSYRKLPDGKENNIFVKPAVDEELKSLRV